MICGSIARSFGRNSRVGQLSISAAAIALPATSASDWVANTTEAFFLREGLQPLAQLLGKSRVVEREPALVDDKERRRTGEPSLDPVEQIGQDRRCRAAADQAFGLEGLHVGFAQLSASASSSRPNGPPMQ